MGFIRKIITCLLPAAAVLLAIPQLANAQATRTWVSGVGDDANPCSRTAPCKTFAGAISKTAANGEINCIDSGGFGTVTITKSIMIDCKGTLAGVLNASVAGIIINSATAQVILRNLDIDGAGSGTVGIRVMQAASVDIEDVIIRGQNGTGIEVVPSTNVHVTVAHTTSRDNAQLGMLVAPTGGMTARVAVSNSLFAGNGAAGVRVNDNGYAAISDSVLTGNASHGAVAFGSASKVMLERVTTSSNAQGGVIANGAGAVVYLSNVLTTLNAYGLYPPIAGGTYVSFGNNRSVGNTISDGSPTSVISMF